MLTNRLGHTGEQIRDHKLACSVINFHSTPDEVFDDHCLEELKEFTQDRSVASRNQWLIERDMVDSPDARRTGEGAASKGSLTGLMIARYGTSDPALDERDWELLEEWFEKGMPVGENVSR